MLDAKHIAAKPEDAGVDSEKLEAVFARVRRDIDDGKLPSAQVAVARRGKIAGLRAFGTAVQGGEERPATPETLYCIYSSTKAVVAAAVWLLFEEGLLRLDERVAEIIPEFGSNGKENVTVEQTMLHVGGYPQAPFPAEHWDNRAALIEAFAGWRLTWEPGSRFEYHATSAHWVLAEIIHRRTGIDYKTFVRDRITGPMGLDELSIGLADDYHQRVADVRYVMEPVEPPGGWGEVTPESILRLNEPAVRRAGLPGGGGFAGAAELALFYQPLINGGQTADGTRIMKQETIDFATKVRTDDRHCDQFGAPCNRGLSIIVAGDDGKSNFRGMGRTVSARAFGHGGAGGQIGWGDPETGISLGYVTEGFVDWMTLGRRVTAVSSQAAVCASDAD